MQEEEIWELTLPEYLKSDIDVFVQGEKEESSLMDCYWGELYGSINMALYDCEISDEEAKYLRKKYLGLEVE